MALFQGRLKTGIILPMKYMDVEEQLALAAQLPPEQEVVILRQFVRAQAKIITELVQTVEVLKHEIGQLKRQLYGRKSEKRIKNESAPVGHGQLNCHT